MRRVCLLFGIVLSLCLLAGPVWSQTTGKMTGKMTDPNGEPLPGANVVIEGTRFGATSDAEGFYLIIGVEPGFYEVKASMVGYEAVVRTNVQVAVARTTVANFTLRESAIEAAEIVVRAQRPLVEVDRTSSEAKISEADISQLPIIRSVREHLQYVAGVDPTRNHANGVAIRRYKDGHTRQWQTWTLDGMELPMYDTGYQSQVMQYNNLPVTSISEIAVVKAGWGASQPAAVSGVVNMVTREGTRVLHGGVDIRIEMPGKRHRGPNVYDAAPGQRGGTNGIWRNRMKWNDPEWVNETDPVTGQQVHVRQDYEGAVGHLVEGWLTGPLGENATFVLSGKTSRAKENFPAAQRTGLRQWSIFGKLSFTPSDNLKLKIGYNQSGQPELSRADRRGPNRNLFLVRDRGHTGYERHFRNQIVYLTTTHTLSQKTFHEFQIGFHGSKHDTTGNTDETTSSWRRDNSGYFNLDRQRRDLRLNYNRRYNFRWDITSQVTRRNLAKAGFTYQVFHNANWDYRQSSASNVTLLVIGKDSMPGQRYVAQRFGAYIEDKIEFQGLIVNAGLRYDRLWGGPKKTLGGWYKGMPGHRTYKAYITRTPREHSKPISTWAPRVGISHPITARSAIRFSFGQYFKPAAFGYLWAEGWLPSDLENHPNLDETWGDEPDKPGGGWHLDHVQRKPTGVTNTTEFEVSSGWNFLANFVLDMATYYRRTDWSTGENFRWFVDPVKGTGRSRSRGPSARAEAKGIETSIYKPLSDNFAFRISLDVGWSQFTWSGGPLSSWFYPDSTYIASSNYFLVDANDDPVPLTDAEIRNIGHKANETIRKKQEALAATEAILTNKTPLRPFREYPDLSSSDRNRSEIQGLWYSQDWTADKTLYVRAAPNTQARFQFLWSTPSDWGPGPTVGGSKLLGGIQANLVWRFHSGDNFKFTPPDNPGFSSSKAGPMFVRTDLNFQKTFEAGTVRPTIYAEVFNLFNTHVESTRSANYVRWGLLRPTPNDPNYERYGDPSPFRGGTPRYVNVGVRIGF